MNAQNKLLHICIYVYIYTYINILHPQNAISEPFWGGFPKTLATIVAIRRSGMLLDFDQTTTAFQNGLQQQSKKHSLRRSTLHVSEANGELVGGWTTHLKNISQNGNLPQIGVKIKNIWNHHLVNHTKFSLSCLGTKIIPPNLSNLNPSRQGQDEVRWMVFHFIWFTQLHIIYLQKHWKDSEFSYIIPDMVSLNHSGAFFFQKKSLTWMFRAILWLNPPFGGDLGWVSRVPNRLQESYMASCATTSRPGGSKNHHFWPQISGGEREEPWWRIGGFLKWWYSTTMGVPTKNDHFGGVLGVPSF